MAPASLTLGESFFHQMWYGGRTAASRVGGGGMARAAPQSDMLFMAIFWISVVSFVFLMALTGIFMVKYRRRPGVAIQRSPAHNTPLELTWTVVPLIALVWIFFEGFWGYIQGETGGSLPEEISLEAQKWSWGMTYSNGAASPDEGAVGSRKNVPIFVAPAGVPVLLKMHSVDVVHSFWVPDFRWKQDIFPNRYTAYAFTPAKMEDLDPAVLQTAKYEDGTVYPYIDHYIFCAEYCGDQHSEMAGILRVVSPADYVKIVTIWSRPTGTRAHKGEIYYKTKGCTSCHSTDGSARTGPTWKDMFGSEVPLEGGQTVHADENYVRESVYNPSAKIVRGFPNSMVSQQGRVNQEELDDIIAYMKSISANAPPSLLDQDKDQGAAAPGAEPAPEPGADQPAGQSDKGAGAGAEQK